jgi:transcriptional regulator with XRE-family HTH domain
MKIIRELANSRGMKLKHLAGEVGITEQGLQLIIKTGKTKTETIKKIAEVLGVEIDYLLSDGNIEQRTLGESSVVYKKKNVDELRIDEIRNRISYIYDHLGRILNEISDYEEKK